MRTQLRAMPDDGVSPGFRFGRLTEVLYLIGERDPDGGVNRNLIKLLELNDLHLLTYGRNGTSITYPIDPPSFETSFTVQCLLHDWQKRPAPALCRCR